MRKPILSIKISDELKGKYKNEIEELQNLLLGNGYDVSVDGLLGPNTDAAIRAFQNKTPTLVADGWVGQNTWKALKNEQIVNYNGPLGIRMTDYFLENDEYFRDIVPKDTVYLHHTAGGGNAYFVTQSWENDKRRNGESLEVATAFIIARKSRSRNPKFNCEEGEIFRAFPEKYWAHHLGLHHPNNTELNAKSIGIEICSYGGLNLSSKGHYTTTYGNVIDEDEVYDHGTEWRGYRYWHKYSDEQIESTRKLLIALRDKFNLYFQEEFNEDWVEFKAKAPFKGAPGIWTHTNVRSDKFDCFPQPELIAMLNSLKNY